MKEEKKKRISIRIAAAAVTAVLFVFLYFAPRYFLPKLGKDPYGEWMEYKREPPTEVITVWHVVGARPYVGSIGAWLEKQASEYKKRFIGVYFSVKAYSVEEAAQEMERGIFPDILSFPSGAYPEELFRSNGTDASPLPDPELLFLSKRVIAYDPSLNEDGCSLLSSIGSEEDFKKGKCLACVCDVRSAGNMLRAVQMGKLRYFEIVPSDEAPLAQYVGITKYADESKYPYAEGLIDFLLTDEVQLSLCGLGIFPAREYAEAVFENDWLEGLYLSLERDRIPGAF